MSLNQSNPEIEIKNVQEKDIDFLLIHEFSSNKDFLKLFVGKGTYKDIEVVKIIHSLMDDSLGETDISVILLHNDKRHALLIENKINAKAMPEQSARYVQRGEKQIKQGMYDSFEVFIIAPQEYLEINSEAKKYPNKISYESVISILPEIPENMMQITLLKRAIEYRGVYEVNPDQQITYFNELYTNYVQTYFPDINPYITSGPRGSKSTWPGFKTPLQNVKITHKSYSGIVDLRFSGIGTHTQKLKNIVESILSDEMFVVQTGKTVNIRINVPKVFFDLDFHSQIDNIYKALKKVSILNTLANNITYKSEYLDIKNSILDLYNLD